MPRGQADSAPAVQTKRKAAGLLDPAGIELFVDPAAIALAWRAAFTRRRQDRFGKTD